jgi:hypothetical protein
MRFILEIDFDGKAIEKVSILGLIVILIYNIFIIMLGW